MWRRLTGFLLALSLALASATMAVVRLHAPGGGLVVTLCSAQGLTTVVLGADGQPVPPRPLCPDCVPHLAAALPGGSAAPGRPAPRLRALPRPAQDQAIPVQAARVPPARAPPRPV